MSQISTGRNETSAMQYKTVFGFNTDNQTLATLSHVIYYLAGALGVWYAYHGSAAAMGDSPWFVSLLAGVIFTLMAVVGKLLQFNKPVFGWQQFGISLLSASLAFFLSFVGLYASNGVVRAVNADRIQAVDTVNTYAVVGRREVGAALAKAAQERDKAIAEANAEATEESSRFRRRQQMVESRALAGGLPLSGEATDETLKLNEDKVLRQQKDAIDAATVKYNLVADHLNQATKYLDELVASQDAEATGVSIGAESTKLQASVVDSLMEAPDFATLAAVARRANGLMQSVNGEYQFAKAEGAISLDPTPVKVHGDHIFVLALEGLKEGNPVAWICLLMAFMIDYLDIFYVFFNRFGERTNMLAKNEALRARIAELEAGPTSVA